MSRIQVIMISHDPPVPQQAVAYVVLTLHEALQCTCVWVQKKQQKYFDTKEIKFEI